jgi:hypothetical protein
MIYAFIEKKRFLAILSCLLLCLIVASSCHDDDHNYVFPPEEDDDLYGAYFDGKVNGERFFVENGKLPEEQFIFCSRSTRFDGEEGGKIDTISFVSSNIVLDNGLIELRLAHSMVPGEHLLLSSYNIEPKGRESVELQTFFRFSPIGEKRVRWIYAPKASHPFSVNVIERFWFPGSSDEFPGIVAELKGIFYNTGNPADSIVIDAIYGIRPRN